MLTTLESFTNAWIYIYARTYLRICISKYSTFIPDGILGECDKYCGILIISELAYKIHKKEILALGEKCISANYWSGRFISKINLEIFTSIALQSYERGSDCSYPYYWRASCEL